MKPYFFLLCCSLLLSNLHAQFQDNFSDGNFSSNPTWTGNADRFLVNAAGELQLNDSMPVATNTTYLVTNAPTSLDDSTTWEFYVRLEFATSTTNFARVYLAANQADLSGNVTGYFLKIGGATGSTDAIELDFVVERHGKCSRRRPRHCTFTRDALDHRRVDAFR